MRTLILGASTNPARYSYMAAQMLDDAGVDFIPVGRKRGLIFGKDILDIRERPVFDDIHTVTLYIGTRNLQEWFDYILELDPIRLIFNPGTENDVLADLAKKQGIIVEYACTLTMITVGTY